MMKPVNEVSVGTFFNFAGNICYIGLTNKSHYIVFPIEGNVPRDKKFGHKVYVYKRIKKNWIKIVKKKG